jgi:two-component SAPR family response regulator
MRRLAAGLGLGAVVVIVPSVLAWVSGAPSWPSFQGATLSGDYVPLDSILEVLALAAWALWAYLFVAVILRTVATVAASRGVRGGDALLAATSLVVPRSLGRLVDVAVGGALLASVLAARHSALADPPQRQAIATVQPAVASNGATLSRPSTHVVYRVCVGDSLWRIAESKLGSGERWREIFELNRGKRFGDGDRLINPRLIRPGWNLTLPEATATAPHRASPIAQRRDRAPHVQSSHQRSTPTTSPSPSQRAHASVGHVRRSVGPVVRLPSGLVVAASFAAGLMSAELVARLRRRRAARIDEEPESLDEPRLVTEMRFAGAGPSSVLRSALRAIDEAWCACRQSSPRLLFAVEEDRKVFAILRDDAEPIPASAGGSIRPLVRFRRADGYLLAEVRGPFASHEGRDQGGAAELLAPLGRSREGGVVHASLHGLGVVSLTGQNASGLGRDVLLACSAAAGPEDLEVMVLGQSPGVEISDLPQCTRIAHDWDDAATAIRNLQAELLRRARLFAEEGVVDIFEHEARHPDDRLPRIVVVADEPPADMRALMVSAGTEGPRFGASLLSVGWTAEGSDLIVEAGAEFIRFETDIPVPDRLTPLLLDDAAAMQAAELIKAAWEDEADDTETVEVTAPIVLEGPVVEENFRVSPDLAVIPEALHIDAPAALETAGDEATPVEAVALPEGTPVVRCLGTLQMERDAKPLRKGWRSKARELVAFLAAHPDGVSKDRIIDVLLPDLDPGPADEEFWRLTSKIRSKVRARDDVRKYVEKAEESFRLEPGAWWVDVWEFERLVREAEPAPRDEQFNMLKAALDLYRGDFCDDTYYSWAEPVRERLRRTFVRAAARVAELLSETGEHDDALNVLNRATTAEPINEELCCRAMALEAVTGHSARALLRYKTLVRVLNEQIGVDPQSATQELANRIEVDAPKQTAPTRAPENAKHTYSADESSLDSVPRRT